MYLSMKAARNNRKQLTSKSGKAPLFLYARKGDLMKQVVYTEEQISQITGILNGLTISGIQNARQITVIAQILESGKIQETEEEER